MIRQTSLEAYRQIEADGLLSKMRFETYKLLYSFGPMTANELMKKAQELNPRKGHQAIESIGRRLSELRDSGVARELGTIICPITKRSVLLWDVTDGLPLKFEKTKRKKCLHCNGKGYFSEAQARMCE